MAVTFIYNVLFTILLYKQLFYNMKFEYYLNIVLQHNIWNYNTIFEFHE
jgi:hypothetical protein